VSFTASILKAGFFFFLARGNTRSKKRPKHAARSLIRLIAWSAFLADGLNIYSAFLADGVIPTQLSIKSQNLGGIQSQISMLTTNR
jgi:hypothetical protein